MLFKLNKTKALEALLFVCNRIEPADKHKISKILYHSDKAHLEKYGRLITGDKYVKMEHGPVPSRLYDLIKQNKENPQVMEVKGYTVQPLRKEKMDEFSESNIECLKAAIDEHGQKNFSQLREESHDATWEAGTMNKKFTQKEFLLTFSDKREIEQFWKNKY